MRQVLYYRTIGGHDFKTEEEAFEQESVDIITDYLDNNFSFIENEYPIDSVAKALLEFFRENMKGRL
jgi:hypothetical protein